MFSAADDLIWSGAYALRVLQLASELGATPEAVLADLDIALDGLLDPLTRLSTAECFSVIERAIAATKDPSFGMRVGLAMSVTWHGHLGLAMLTSPTLGDALALVERFSATRCAAIGFRRHVEPGFVSLMLEERSPLGSLTEFFVTAIFVGLVRMASSLTGRPVGARVEVAFRRPAVHWALEGNVRLDARFQQPQNRIVFDAPLLSLPIPTADPVALRQAQDACERELAAMRDPERIFARVRARLRRKGGGFRAEDEVAALLHVSTRTLRRQLAIAGTTFSAQLDLARRDLALALIDDRARSLDEIAIAVGYSDVSNFTRAFRRWTGITPAVFRRRK